MRSKLDTPLSSQHTASPSRMQERERRRAMASTMRTKREVRSLPGRLYNRKRSPSLRAMTRKPSCLISCSHASPEGGTSAELLFGSRRFYSRPGDLEAEATRGERQLPPAVFRLLARGAKKNLKRTRPNLDVPPFRPMA